MYVRKFAFRSLRIELRTHTHPHTHTHPSPHGVPHTWWRRQEILGFGLSAGPSARPKFQSKKIIVSGIKIKPKVKYDDQHNMYVYNVDNKKVNLNNMIHSDIENSPKKIPDLNISGI